MNRLSQITQIVGLLFLLVHVQTLNAQITGGFSPNDPMPQEAKAAGLGGYVVDGNVNTFTGEYSYNYKMGAVSTPGGLSYALNLVYSSSHMTGSNVPILDGIPYGTGWDVDLPYITTDYSVLASYTQADLGSYMSHMGSLGFPYNRDKMLKVLQDDGRLLWEEPVVHIPGVFSGRMIFKRFEGNTAVFVPFSFEKYLELHLLGSSFSVHLDDGTVYEFGVRKINYRKAPNKKIYGYTENSNIDYLNQSAGTISNGDNTDGVNSGTTHLQRMQYVPKPEVLKWYCTRITNKNIPSSQGITFTYEKFGKFNFFAQFSKYFDQHLANRFAAYLGADFSLSYGVGAGAVNSSGQGASTAMHLDRTFEDFEVHKEVVLKNVTAYDYFSNLQKIQLNYKTKKFTNLTTNALALGEPGVHRHDSLYNYKSVYYQGTSSSTGVANEKPYFYDKTNATFFPVGTQSNFSGWNRWLHVRHDDIQDGNITGLYTPSKTNPYKTNTPYGYRGFYQNIPSGNGALDFNHGVLESNKITNGEAMVPGDLYELRTVLAGNSPKKLCLFDIEVRMDNSNYAPSQWNGGSSGVNNKGVNNVLYSEFEKGERVYSTFSNAVKWSIHQSRDVSTIEENTRATSDFFMMPAALGNNALKIRIGPANSDNEFDWAPHANPDPLRRLVNSGFVGAYQTYPARLYTGVTSSGGSINLTYPSAPMPQNFGIGMPWWQTRNMYRGLAHHMGYGDAFGFWWQRHSTKDAQYASVNTWPNHPTLASSDVELKAVELIRYSKNTYCLDNVEVMILNGESSQFADVSGWTVVKKTQFDHENRTREVKFSGIKQQSIHNVGPSNESEVVYYNKEVAGVGKFLDSTVSNHWQNQVVLSKITEIPINPINNRTSISANEITASPSYHFDYTLQKINIDLEDFVTMNRIYRMGSSMGGLLLTGYTNPLGGEVKLDIMGIPMRKRISWKGLILLYKVIF
jgi:hypothetical protein